MIIRVYVNSGYGSHFSSHLSDLTQYVHVQECMIPGPLVPFFQSLGAVNGPFDWIGDIVAGLPNFDSLWNQNWFPEDNFCRQVPIPAIILDQLHRFATTPLEANTTTNYLTFQWYHNIFQQDTDEHDARLHLGPQLCGSLFTTQAQCDNARNFWSAALATGITRANANEGNPAFANYFHLFGFLSQNNTSQMNWFQQTVTVMQKYAQYFNGSVPLKSILPTGIGACVCYGYPRNNPAVRNWVYPPLNELTAFLTSRFAPRRELPDTMRIRFSHADHEIEEQAEQYAILTHTNMRWINVPTQHTWAAIDDTQCHEGSYWTMIPYRHSQYVTLKPQYAQIVASRYHQQAANRAD